MTINKIKYISKILSLSFLLSFILVGSPKVVATNYDYSVTPEYIKSLGGNDSDEFLKSYLTIDGGFIALGNTKSTDIEGVDNKGGIDAIIAKYDKNGNQQWIKSFGSNNRDYFYSVVQMNDNGFIVAGTTSSTDIEGVNNKGEGDAIIIKFDPNGNQQWIKSFGGNKNDYFNSIIQTVDSGFVVTGITSSTDIEGVDNKGGIDAIIAKYDKDGNQQWIKSFGGNSDDYFSSIIQTDDNGFISVDRTSSTDIEGIDNKGGYDSVMVKYDKDGNQQWIKSFGGNDYDSLTSIIQTNDNGFIVAGTTSLAKIDGVDNKGNVDAIIVKYDKDGNQQWIKSFGGNYGDYFYSAIQTNDNGFIAIGWIHSTNIEGINNEGGREAIIVKYDKDGNQQWIKSFGGNSWVWFTSIIQIDDSSLIVIGTTYSTNIEGIDNKGGSDAFIVKYTETKTIIPEQSSANLNVEIITDNSLELSISTNKISFEGYNGVEDLPNNNLNLTVSSGLNYDLYATLDSEIRGTNDTNAIIDKANLKIKTSDDLEYKSFTNIGERVNLVANHKNGKDVLHNINLKLLKDSSVKADTYNTNITFEVIQK